jgi:hypothetical protein
LIDLIFSLGALNLSGKDRTKVGAALRYIGYVQRSEATNLSAVEKNIDDTVKAIDSLIEIENAHRSKERLMTDGLLVVWDHNVAWKLHTIHKAISEMA